ncbi:SOS response-associated peptidase family protein [Undibacterium arcticum]
MCGRITQTKEMKRYAKRLGFDPQLLIDFPEEAINNYNCSPGAPHWTMRLHDGMLVAEEIKWHWLSSWAKKKKGMTPAINAKLEKLLTPYYRGLMKQGRIIVPADGWYERIKSGNERIPWYIKPKIGRRAIPCGAYRSRTRSARYTWCRLCDRDQ